MEKRHRIFIAINLPEDIKKELYSYSEKWPELPAKWSPKDNLHITLEFLGALTDVEVGEVCLAVKSVAEMHKGFSLNINKVLYAPVDKIPPGMIWVQGDKSEELSALRNDLADALTEKVAFIPEIRVSAFHITLARINAFAFRAIEPEERPEVNENIDLIFSVESIDVMESESRKGGPQYTVLESFELGN